MMFAINTWQLLIIGFLFLVNKITNKHSSGVYSFNLHVQTKYRQPLSSTLSTPSISSSTTTTHLAFLNNRYATSTATSTVAVTSKCTTALQVSTSSTSTTKESSSSSSSTSRRRPNRTIKRSILDRTSTDAIELVNDIVKIITDAGIRAGPQRTLQALIAISQINQQYLPQLLSVSSTKELTTLVPKIVRTLFEKLGATYVKLGQFIASSPTLFPPEYVTEFQKCLDQTEPIPFTTIKRIIETELQQQQSSTTGTTTTNTIDTIFSYIDPQPLASASIAQVHRATIRDTGEQVVIKVQKPNIDQYLQADLSFIYIASRLIEYIQPEWERTSLSTIISDIRISMLQELDFTIEARNTIEFYQFLQQQQLLKKATAPRVLLQYTTKRIMTMEYLNGISLLDDQTIQKVQTSNTGTDVILTALNIWSLSIREMPWFHADVHAGNLLLLNDGRVGFIDFGIVGKISPKVLNSVNELSASLVLNDYIGMATALCNMGATETNVDINSFATDIERVLEKINSVQIDITAATTTTTTTGSSTRSGTTTGTATSVSMNVDENDITNLLLELVAVTENNGLKLPREFGLLVKQALYFDRYLKILAPNIDVMTDERIVMSGTSTGTTTTDNNNNKKSSDKRQTIIDV